MINKNLLFNSLSNAYEEAFVFLFILFCLGVLLYIFHEKFAGNYKEEKKLFNFASSMIAIPNDDDSWLYSHERLSLLVNSRNFDFVYNFFI